MSFAADMTPAVSMEMIMIFRERLPGYIKTTKAYSFMSPAPISLKENKMISTIMKMME